MERRTILSPGQSRHEGLTAARIAGILEPSLACGFAADCWTPFIESPAIDPNDAAPRPAAVLVPLVDRPEGLTILLTERTQHLSRHAGQVSFPGGRIDADDADPPAAALREAFEEVGLAPGRVTIIGRLDTRVTATGYSIIPVVGLVRPPLELVIHEHEVAAIFEVPLSLAADPANYRSETRDFTGRGLITYTVLPFDSHWIWGATAGILLNLAHVLTAGTNADDG